MKKMVGPFLILVGVICFLSFKIFFVDPAFTKLPNGNYGELYGPVSYFRLPVYGICILIVIVG